MVFETRGEENVQHISSYFRIVGVFSLVVGGAMRWNDGDLLKICMEMVDYKGVEMLMAKDCVGCSAFGFMGEGYVEYSWEDEQW